MLETLKRVQGNKILFGQPHERGGITDWCEKEKNGTRYIIETPIRPLKAIGLIIVEANTNKRLRAI
jgi:hypothetical protein